MKHLKKFNENIFKDYNFSDIDVDPLLMELKPFLIDLKDEYSYLEGFIHKHSDNEYEIRLDVSHLTTIENTYTLDSLEEKSKFISDVLKVCRHIESVYKNEFQIRVLNLFTYTAGSRRDQNSIRIFLNSI